MSRILVSMVAVMLSLGILVAESRAVPVDGYCYLEGADNHSGTRVLFQEASPTAETDSVLTDPSGYYQIDVAAGIYDVLFTHEGYWELELETQNLFDSATLTEMTLFIIQEMEEISGDLSDTISSGTYLVIGDIRVEEEDTLVINPGAEFVFNGNFRFEVGGILEAIGTAEDSIIFRSNIEYGVFEWRGIDHERNYSVFDYCAITNAREAIECYYTSDSTMISNCTINGSEGTGIECSNDNTTIVNCSIIGNGYNGISCSNFNTKIVNCTVYGNAIRGINCYYVSPIIQNCIIASNCSAGIYCYPDAPFPEVSYCNIFDNHPNLSYNFPDFFGEMITVNSNGDSCDAYMNIFLDPLFVDADGNDFYLQQSSPCIDAGNPESPFDPDSTIADIGAFYFNQTGVPVKLEFCELPTRFSVSNPYPNPFNPFTSVTISLPEAANLRVNVFNINGRSVSELAGGHYPAGCHSFTFDGSSLASGIYFIRAIVPGIMYEIKKVVLIK